MVFPKTDLLLTLHELEQQFINLGQGVIEQCASESSSRFKCREMGRAHGFLIAAHLIDEKINRLFG